MKFNENGFSMDPNAETIQEGFDAGVTAGFKDFMDGDFDYPKDQSSNHSQLKADQEKMMWVQHHLPDCPLMEDSDEPV